MMLDWARMWLIQFLCPRWEEEARSHIESCQWHEKHQIVWLVLLCLSLCFITPSVGKGQTMVPAAEEGVKQAFLEQVADIMEHFQLISSTTARPWNPGHVGVELLPCSWTFAAQVASLAESLNLWRTGHWPPRCAVNHQSRGEGDQHAWCGQQGLLRWKVNFETRNCMCIVEQFQNQNLVHIFLERNWE